MREVDLQERPAAGYPLLAHALNLALILLLFGYSAVAFDGLPDRIPVHYDARGVPNGWAAKTWIHWLTLPFFALGLTGLFYLLSPLIRWLAPRHPKWINVPAKKTFLQLDPEDRLVVVRAVMAVLYWVCVPLNALFFYLQWGSARVAKGEWDSLPPGAMFVLFAAMAILLVVFLVRVRRLVLRLAAADAAGESRD